MVNKQRLLDHFLKLVKIDSLSGKEGEISQLLKKELSQLGLEVLQDEANKPINGQVGNIIAKLKGTLKGAPPILLNAHLDTVKPGEKVNPQIKEGIIYSDGKTILGADDKSGVSAIMEALRVLQTQKILHGPLEIVFTISEETGLWGTKYLDYSLLESKIGFVLDSGKQVGTITTQAPTQDWIKAKILGKAAHAGVCPEEGINAIQVASQAIANMPLGRIDEETTANIGIIKGGRATNIVPDEVEVQGEARSRNHQKLNLQIEKMRKAFEESARKFGAKAEIEIEKAYPDFKVEETHPVIRIAEIAAQSLGLKTILKASGGGSDANIFNSKGITSVILSTGAENSHTLQEYIALQDLVKTTQYILAIIEEAARVLT